MRALALALVATTALGCDGRGPPSPSSPPVTARPEVSPTPLARGFETGARTTARVVLLCDAPMTSIHPWIYGMAFQPMRDLPAQWTFGATARRWGGNHTSRYNWELGNAWNTGQDWFFKNVDYDHRSGAAHQRFLDDDATQGVASALTIPLLGWVAKDTSSYGFPVRLYGDAQATEPGKADVGNGRSRQGALVTPQRPELTSVPLPPESVGRWVKAIREQDRRRGRRSVDLYLLDNEPTLWSETHRDVHPEPVSYDELLDKTLRYASAIREADPDARIAGPAAWGWPAYFGSGVDKAASPAHPDRDRHGGVALLPWWMRSLATEEKRTGVHLVDHVDVHFYPQGKDLGVGTAGGTDPDTAARRIRATRSLWDPSYRDESWIAEPIALLPRLKRWIGEENPSLGVVIGEWNFGAENHMSGGLAVAEALGRFGTEGVASAFYWDYPPPGSPAQMAFRVFRNFDGHGGHFLDHGVKTSSSVASLSSFASREGDHLVVVLLALEPGAALLTTVDASACGNVATQRTYHYRNGTPGLVERTAASGTDALTLPIDGYSMTVLDLHVGHTP